MRNTILQSGRKLKFKTCITHVSFSIVWMSSCVSRLEKDPLECSSSLDVGMNSSVFWVVIRRKLA